MSVLGGLFAGGLASLALLQVLRKAKQSTSMHTILAMAGYGLLGVVLSFLVLLVGVFVCLQVFPEKLLMFSIVEVVAFVVFTTAHILWHEKAVKAHAQKRRTLQ